MKLQDYTMELMLEKELYIMLPFLFFNYEKQLEKTADPKVYSEIEGLYETNVKAIRAYSKIGFDVVGECSLYNQHFLCYEKALGE